MAAGLWVPIETVGTRRHPAARETSHSSGPCGIPETRVTAADLSSNGNRDPVQVDHRSTVNTPAEARVKYQSMSSQAKGRYLAEHPHCMLCPGVSVVVDHDHATGSVRGALCRRCNGTLGSLEAALRLPERGFQTLAGDLHRALRRNKGRVRTRHVAVFVDVEGHGAVSRGRRVFGESFNGRSGGSRGRTARSAHTERLSMWRRKRGRDGDGHREGPAGGDRRGAAGSDERRCRGGGLCRVGSGPRHGFCESGGRANRGCRGCCSAARNSSPVRLRSAGGTLPRRNRTP
ncbi:endonuclease domain-containing protein [Embleya sp. NPDC127516]|uniref:endonuclease domain-containing protein n=1 Tax=Embleya sp. NPDC127516 TaxID=3363990 RepID=UPI003823CF15